MLVLRLMVGAAVMLAAAGCSGDPVAPRPSGELPPGTATVVIGDGPENTVESVSCQSYGAGSTAVAIGSSANGVTAYLDDDQGPIAKSVSITGIDGFTGSYWQDVQGEATLTMSGSAVVVSGAAAGYAVNAPNAHVSKTFRISAAC